MKKKSDDLFINMLLQETYKFVPEDEISKNNSDLEEYFSQCEENSTVLEGDLHLLNFLEKNCNEICQIFYDERISCFRLKFRSNLLDMPKNWGEFKYLFECFETKKNILCELKDEETGLRDIFLSIEKNDKCSNHYFILNYKSYLYFVSVESTELISFSSWLKKYMGLLEEVPFEYTDAA